MLDPSTLPGDGWRCLRITDLGAAVGYCDRCGKEKLRFVHHLEHPGVANILCVGCICAGEMLGDPEGVRRRERRMKGRAMRKARWLRRKWKPAPDRSLSLWWRDREVTLFQVIGGPEHNKWAFTIDGELGASTYASPVEAKAAIFDLLYEQG